MAAKRKKAAPKSYGKAAHAKIEKVMHEFKHGTLHSGRRSGPKVTSRPQAIAIALSEARQAGGKVPSRPAPRTLGGRR
jgi:hypothetical protein